MRTTGKPFNIGKKQVYEAYQAVKSNGGAPGVDGQTIEQFEADLKSNLYKLWNRMSSGSYFPPPVRAVSIPKKSGGQRTLGVPTVADRVAQKVVKQVIEPTLDAVFLADSYGYRPGKSALDAVGVTRERCWKYDWVLEFDIKGLFDNIEHTLLMRAVRKHVTCQWALLYIERWLKAPMVDEAGERIERSRGTPQGGVVSPWTQKITLSLSDRLRSAVRSRYLTCVVKGNMVASHGPIYSHRKGSALEYCIRSDRPWLQPQRGRRGVGRAVRFIAPPSLPIPAGSARTQAASSSLRADHSHHDQGSWRRSGRASGVRANERPDHWRDGGARRLRFPRQDAPAWLIAVREAMTFTWNMPLTAYWQQNWRRSMTSLCRIASAAPASLVR
jgi:retron-type reverse transcriptase